MMGSDKPYRPWTEQEKLQLVKQYFERLPGNCPVCAHEVSMMMENRQDSITMALVCRKCRNIGRVSPKSSQSWSKAERLWGDYPSNLQSHFLAG
jgi:hypothetical protein